MLKFIYLLINGVKLILNKIITFVFDFVERKNYFTLLLLCVSLHFSTGRALMNLLDIFESAFTQFLCSHCTDESSGHDV